MDKSTRTANMRPAVRIAHSLSNPPTWFGLAVGGVCGAAIVIAGMMALVEGLM